MKKKVDNCHSFPQFGQIILSLSVVPLKSIEMLAEEKNHFEDASRGEKTFQRSKLSTQRG